MKYQVTNFQMDLKLVLVRTRKRRQSMMLAQDNQLGVFEVGLLSHLSKEKTQPPLLHTPTHMKIITGYRVCVCVCVCVCARLHATVCVCISQYAHAVFLGTEQCLQY